jgi:hypothetical protein
MADPKNPDTLSLIQQTELTEKLNSLQKELVESANDLDKVLSLQIEQIKTKNQLEQLERNKQIEHLSKLEKLTEIQKQELQALVSLREKENLASQKEIQILEKQKTLNEKQAQADQEKLKRYAGFIKHQETMKVKASELYQIALKQSKEDARATFAAKFQELGTAAVAATLAVVKANMEFASLAASVRAATYTAGEYDKAITNITKSNVSFGVTNEESAKAITGLHENFAEFTSLSETGKAELEDLAVKMGKAGISADLFAKSASVLTKGFGMNVTQIKKFNQEVVLFAKANGISQKMISQGLSDVLPKLSAFGDKGPTIFKNLAYQAKQTGIEMSGLLGITEQLTTYEGAAEFAGKLNALFGKQLFDTMETLRLSTEDPAKMIETIRNRLQSVGKTFSQMSPSFKRALAHDMNIPLEQLTNMMSKNSAQLRDEQANQEKFNEAVQAFVPVGDKMKALFAAFVPIFTNVIQSFESVITSITEFVQENKSLVEGIGIFVTVAGTAIAIIQGIGFAVNVVSSTLGLLRTAFGFKTAATVADTAATAANTAANTANAASTSAAAAATTASNAAIGASAPLLSGAIIPMLAFGAAVLMAGIGALAMGAGIYLAVTATTALITVLIAAGDGALIATLAFIGIAGGIWILAQALLALGITGAAGAAIIGVLTLAALAFAAAYKIIGDSMDTSVKAIKQLADMDLAKFEKLRDIFGQMAGYMGIVGLAAESLTGIFALPVMEPIIAAAAAITPASSGVESGALTATSTSGGGSAASGEKEVTINIKIDSPIKLDATQVSRFVHEEVQSYTINKNGIVRQIANASSKPQPIKQG